MAKRKVAESRVLITGASSGIGSELASALASRNARLVITARRGSRLNALADRLREEFGNEVHPVAGDITDADLRRELAATTKREFGALDLLVNNAGIGGPGPFASSDEERLRRIMEVNFFAPAELLRCCLPLLHAGARPMVVNVGSVLGHRAVPNKSEYCASKFAIHGFTDALRCELSPAGIDVLLVSPSTTASEFFEAAGDSGARKHAQSPRRVAEATIRAIELGRHEIILTPGGKALVWLDRLCPPLVNRLVARFG